jgi:hypothetical protein
LSKSTLTTLKNLKSPVRVTFYSLLGDADVRESTSPFVSRVGQLLSAFERAADGKLQVTQHVAVSEEAMRSAAKDGVTPFNIEKGEACYLGIVVGQGERTEAIQRLAPEWEQALEFDLTRAIQRVTKPEQRQPSPAETVRINPATTDEVKRLIPNYGSVSIEQGTAILREAARKEFTEAATALQAQLKEAQDRFTQLTQSGGTEAEQQAALKHFQAVQAEQTEKLNEIAARLHERIAALEKMRGEAE